MIEAPRQRSQSSAKSAPGLHDAVIALYSRVTSIGDTVATYSYTYNPYASDFYGSAANGRGQLASVQDSSASTATITYAYDELGRATGQSINGTANQATQVLDGIGRAVSWTNALGTFTPTYQNAAYGVNRLSSLALPNGQVTNFQWENKTGDFRLKQIANLGSGSTALSQFDYVTDPMRILQWTQQRGTTTPETYTFGYNAVDELTSAVLRSGSTVIKSYGYTYDEGSNRTSEQIDGVARSASYNALNQLTSTQAGGATLFKGTLNEPGTVTVGGTAAQMTGGTNFVAKVNLTAGTNSVAVTAKDASNNTRTSTYQVVVPGGATVSLSYDANGNMTSDGTRSYSWDAKNQLVGITYADGSRSEFGYDCFGRRVGIVEKNTSGVATSSKKFVWSGLNIAEERSGSTVTKQFFGNGWKDVAAGTSYFYSRDHLGSIREVTDGSSALLTRYDYDPYGRVSKLTGTVESDFRYTGHYFHAPSGLHLAPFRSYDANLGRWISRDPIGEAGGINLYRYVANSSVNLVDPLGLVGWGQIGNGLVGAVAGAAAGAVGGALVGLVLGGPAGAAAGALGGAAWGALSGGMSGLMTSECFDAGAAAGNGALSGLFSGITGAAGAASMVLGMLAGGVTGAIGAGIGTGGDLAAISFGFALGAAFGGAGSAASGLNAAERGAFNTMAGITGEVVSGYSNAFSGR